VIVGLGKIGFEAGMKAFRDLGHVSFSSMPRFAHGAEYRFGEYTFRATYHPSQQNTFTGRLTRSMLKQVFVAARRDLL
jgi:uracil-DNA glycosylase